MLPAAVLPTRTRRPCRPSSAAGDDLAFDLRQTARFALGNKRRQRLPAELARFAVEPRAHCKSPPTAPQDSATVSAAPSPQRDDGRAECRGRRRPPPRPRRIVEARPTPIRAPQASRLRPGGSTRPSRSTARQRHRPTVYELSAGIGFAADALAAAAVPGFVKDAASQVLETVEAMMPRGWPRAARHRPPRPTRSCDRGGLPEHSSHAQCRRRGSRSHPGEPREELARHGARGGSPHEFHQRARRLRGRGADGIV